MSSVWAQRQQIPLQHVEVVTCTHGVLVVLLSTVVQLFSLELYVGSLPTVGTIFLPPEQVLVLDGVNPPIQALDRPYGVMPIKWVGLGAILSVSIVVDVRPPGTRRVSTAPEEARAEEA